MRTLALIGLVFLTAWTGDYPAPRESEPAPICLPSDPPVYYAIDLVSTKRLPGTRRATGTVDMTFKPSPFAVTVSGTGVYRYDLRGRTSNLKPPKQGTYVVWLSTPDLSEVRLLGPLSDEMTFEGEVDYLKFLVIVTLEEAYDPEQERWNGPVALRGLSRSGLMHTMAGHGPFQSEPCAFYGYR